MGLVGPEGFWVYLAVLMSGLAGYAGWRMTRRVNTVSVDDTVSYAPVTPAATAVVVGVAQEYYAETMEDASGENADIDP